MFRCFTLVTLLFVCASCTTQDSKSTMPFEAQQGNQAQGLWRSKGYGYILQLKQDSVLFYDISKQHCLINTFMSNDHTYQQLMDIVTLQNADVLHLPWENFPIEFERIDRLPKLCQQQKSTQLGSTQEYSAPVAVFDVFWQTFAEHYAFNQEKQWDWQAKYAEWRAKLHNDMDEDALLGVLEQLMESLRDGHAIVFDAEGNEVIKSKFPRKPEYKKRLYQAFQQQQKFDYYRPFYWHNYRQWQRVLNSYLTAPSVPAVVDEDIVIATLAQHVHYIRIDEMGGYVAGDRASQVAAVDAVMQNLLPELANAEGLVIDLRLNGGGHDDIANAWLSYLINKELVTGRKRIKLATGFGAQRELLVRPAQSDRDLGPIVALISEETASAAESFLQGLRARGSVIFVGENSFGALSTMLFKTLPNGWSFSLSNSQYLAHDGTNYEFVGLPVDHKVAFRSPEQIDTGVDLAIEKALQILKTLKGEEG